MKSEEVRMKKDLSEERFIEQKVTYTLEVDGRFVIVENVPARVSERTGERFFLRKLSSPCSASFGNPSLHESSRHPFSSIPASGESTAFSRRLLRLNQVRFREV